MKKRIISVLFALAVIALPVTAFISGHTLDRSLRGVKEELRGDYRQLQAAQAQMSKLIEGQHSKMLDMLKEGNELAMSLYLQKKDYTFDLSYVLKQVDDQYNDFTKDRRPFDKIVRNMDVEIGRYARLLEALRRLPPELTDLNVVPDSLSYQNDSLEVLIKQAGTSLQNEVIAMAMSDSARVHYVLSEAGQLDRDTCIFYASELLKMYAAGRERTIVDSTHYQEAYIRLKESYDYAAIRYEMLQDEIFKDGQTRWSRILANPKVYWRRVQASAKAQYAKNPKPDEFGNFDSKGEKTIQVVMVMMLIVMLLFSWLIGSAVFWLLCKIIKPLGRIIPREHRPSYALLLGIALYFFLFGAEWNNAENAFVQLALRQFATLFWLLAIIIVALMIRMKPERLKYGIRMYVPTFFMALTVIACRVTFLPNAILNYFFPPILILLSIWQLVSCLLNSGKAHGFDRFYCWISFGVTLAATITAICGYIFLALMVLVWWYFQLAAVLTISTVAYLAKLYKDKRMTPRVRAYKSHMQAATGVNQEALTFRITWFYDLLSQFAIPLLGLLSIPLCIKLSLDVFDFEDLFQNFYYSSFIQLYDNDGEATLRASISSLVILAGLFFLFKYLNKVFHALWQEGRYAAFTRKYKRSMVRSNEINLSLGNSLITVIVWFLYIVAFVQMLHIPMGSLSLVAGGLSAGVGLALKDIINNFIYGIQLMSGRLRVGDWIECDGVRGQVNDISYQSTQVETINGTYVSFLNATLFSKSFVNLTKGNSYEMLKLTVGVAYGTDVQKVREALEKAMEVMKTKDSYGRDVVEPKHGIYVRVNAFADSAVEIVVKQYVLAAEHIPYSEKAREVIYNALNENGITIPFPQRDIHIYSSK